jgi:hypothetical protein
VVIHPKWETADFSKDHLFSDETWSDYRRRLLLKSTVNCSTKFKVGDIVEATGKIWRKDGRSELQPGDYAKVREVWQTTPESPQIIGLEIKGKLPMGGIVCFENVPLRLVY